MSFVLQLNGNAGQLNALKYSFNFQFWLYCQSHDINQC